MAIWPIIWWPDGIVILEFIVVQKWDDGSEEMQYNFQW